MLRLIIVACYTKPIVKRISVAIPPIRRYPSRKEWEIACWEKIRSSKDLMNFLVTAHERQIFVLRAAVIERLLLGKSYQQIEQELWLSPQTISGIKKALQDENYMSYGERNKKVRGGRLVNPTAGLRKVRRLGMPHRTKYGTVFTP